MTRTRAHTAALRTMPPGQHLPTLRVWAEWRRQGVSIAELGRRAGYNEERVRKLLEGRAMWHRDLVARDLAEVLGL